MKRPTYLSLVFSLFYLCALLPLHVYSATVQLDENRVVSNCRSSSSQCNFLSNDIWVGSTAPSDGDDVIMSLSGSSTAYVSLDDGSDLSSLSSLQMSGPIVFSMDTSFLFSFDTVVLDSLSQLLVADANLLVNSATVTGGATLRLSGNANFTASDFNSSGARVTLLDTCILQGETFTLDGINATSSANFAANNVTLLQGAFGVNISCPVDIDTLVTAPNSVSSIFGGSLGQINMLANSTLYAYNDITIASLAMSNSALFFGSGDIVFEGGVTGAGALEFVDSEVLVGNPNISINLLSIPLRFTGFTNATFYNVQFGQIATDNLPDLITPPVTLNLYGSNFSVSNDFIANIYAENITFRSIGINVTGTITSTGTFIVLNGGIVNVSKIIHTGGSVEIYAPVITSEYFSINNSSLYLTAPITGITNLTATTIPQTEPPIFFYGSISLSSCNISVPQNLSISVGGEVYGNGSNALSGNITANAFFFGGNGQLATQGSMTATTIVIHNTVLSTQNTTNIYCPAIAIDASTISISSPLSVYGSLILRSFYITSNNNQTIFVNGSLYSFGNSSISSSVNIIASTFTHIGDHVYIQGIISAGGITFVNADVFVAAPVILTGNTSIATSIIRLHASLHVQGSLYLSSTIQSAGVQKVVVNESIYCTGDSYIYDFVRVYTPYYAQTSGSLHLFGILLADSIEISRGAILSTKMPNVIYGNVHVQGGLLEFHNATNITGSLILDPASQTMVYNLGTNYPIIQVNGSLHLNGALVYWINPAPVLNAPIVFKVFTYSGDLQGRFASYDAYAPNKPAIKMLKFNLIYGDKDIRLEYNPAKQLGVGAVVGIVLGTVVGVTALVIVGLIYYRRYRKRQKYTTIEKFEAEIDRFISN